MSKRSVGLSALLSLTFVALAASAYASGSLLPLGPATKTRQLTYQAYYDGHKDAYLVTDVSSKTQARALHVNYAAELGHVKGLPAQYFVKGPAASGQISVFGSEPGETDYNPLWEEFFVTWKAGATPVLLVKDDQIKALAKKGEVTLRDAHVVLNAPIIKVGK
ncbi:MAG TPA: hypothetical protein VFK62_03840 [Gaiellaceae bacterium]|nr:hypothetical protein [Gaiellaceae bacterium]